MKHLEAEFNGIKFIRQEDSHTCGPVAIFNVLRWSGLNANKLHYNWIVNELKVEYNQLLFGIMGTTEYAFNKVLKYLSEDRFEVKRTKKKVDAKWVKGELKKDKAVVMMYENKNGGLHFTMLVGSDKNGFIAINDDPKMKKAVLKRKYSTIERHLARRDNGFPVLWIVSKKD